MYMRIIAGKLKGRTLHSFHAPHIRPTTDRVKETMFNKLMGRLAGASVLDLFSGTGNLGIESYSRGATEVCLVEDSPQSIKIIKKNIYSLGISKFVEIVKSDVFSYLKGVEPVGFDLIFVDPPFTKTLAHRLMGEVSLRTACCPGGLIILESSKQEQLEESYAGYDLWDKKSFGDKILSIWTRLE